MKNHKKTGLLLAFLVTMGTAFAFIQGNRPSAADHPGACCSVINFDRLSGNALSNAPVAPAETRKPLPKLLDLGAGKCIPCKMMAPILEQLKKEYAGKLEVEFIDVWKNPDAGKPYAIKVIPTQIFFDASGKELFRHIGFYSMDDILAKWKELGVDLKGAK
jgi:thioredoxin 1